MEVGQPGTPAPARARAALAQAMEAGPLGYTVALGLPALRARIARLYAGLVRGGPRSGAGGGDGGVVGGVHPRVHVACSTGATGWRSASRAIRATGNILSALDLVPVGIPTGPESRFQPPPRRSDAGSRPGRWSRARRTRRGRCSATAELAALIERGGGARDRFRLGRDLSRHPVRRPGGDRARDL